MRMLLRMQGITKSYPGVSALRDVDLNLQSGEVLALMGENGAGKSTLIKILGGAVAPDAGEISIADQAVTISNPQDARRAGIGVIYQEFNLVAALSARENIFLGREQARLGFVRRRQEQRLADELLTRVGAKFDSSLPCRRLSIAQQQAVEIAKTLSQQVRILVMDEPTAALAPQDVENLLNIIADLRRQGIGIIYISHRLDEVMRIADRITVLRDGQHVATVARTEVSRAQLIEMMVGRELASEFPKRTAHIGPDRLQVAQLSRAGVVHNVSLTIRRGEIVGLTGLIGSGRTEAARLLFGADRADAGSITLDGKKLSIRSPRDAIAAGICLLTEDRKQQGLVLGLSVIDNFGLPNLRRLATAGVVRQRELRASFAGFANQLRIKTPSDRVRVRNLSGGNQQKVVLAKWLMSESEVVIFDEPTRGIDVGAKFEIYQLIGQLADAGKAILMISSELPEVLGMSDRILVMHDGRISGEITDVARATPGQIMQLAVS